MNSVNKSERIFSIPDLDSLMERTVDELAATTDNPEDLHDAKVRNLYSALGLPYTSRIVEEE